MYEVRVLPGAFIELQRLDRSVARRIVTRLDWLAINFNLISPEPLSGELAGLFKLRVGDYRIIYENLAKESVLLVHAIGHRREVYKR